MGVAKLWDVIRPSAEARSLSNIAVVDGFEANPHGRRGYRIGIDASIWFFHAQYGKEGENPELRTLFFRCARLMAMPLLPVFVFDGPKRPSIKRGKRVSGNAHWLVTGMKEIIEAFGFEWRTAPGEAEAELAYLNGIGVIDAVLSDDVDNFLFGAQTVLRNPSNTLSGNRSHPVTNSAGKDDKQHVMVYRAQKILEDPDIQLTRGGFILIGLLSGGDYDDGVRNCGPSIAHGLARCGFGDELLKAAETLDDIELRKFLVEWRGRLVQELRTNSRGLIGRKCVALAKKFPEAFPDPEILRAYAQPITSRTEGRSLTSLRIKWDREPNLMMLAALCERKFEWGYKSKIIYRFKTVIWQGAVQRILRRAAMDIDFPETVPSHMQTPRKANKAQASPSPCGTPSKMIAHYFSSLRLDSRDAFEDGTRLIHKIHSARTHASTDGVLEYRLEIDPAQLVRITEEGIQGLRADTADGQDDSGWGSDCSDSGEIKKPKKQVNSKPPDDPYEHLRLWMPASMVRIAEPGLVADFEEARQRKADKKAGKGIKKPAPSADGGLAQINKPAKKRAHKKIPASGDKDKCSDGVRRNLTAVFAAQSPIREATQSPGHAGEPPSPKIRRKPSPIPYRLGDYSSDDEEENFAPSQAPDSKLSTTRAVAALPTLSAPKSSCIPRPFPMALPDFRSPVTVAVDDVFGSSSTSSTPVKRREPASQPSDTDDGALPIHKSPRKGRKQGSPRSKDATSSSEEEMRPPRQLKGLGGSVKRPLRVCPIPQQAVIEISSDSDSNLAKKPMHPLYIARARVHSKKTGSDALSRTPKKHAQSVELECIDLTYT